MVKRLIVSLDQSTLSESALPLARGLARQLELPVTLLTVVDAPAALLRAQGSAPEASAENREREYSAPPLMPSATAVSGSPISQADLEKLATKVADAERYLRGIAESFSDVNVETEVLYGDPAERILSFAETREQPALVMASHGRSGFQRMVLGSVTARLVQATHLPVFVVRGNDAISGDGERHIEKLLVPLDDSRFSAQALTAVHEIFGAKKLNLVLLRVVETQRSRGAYEHSVDGEFVISAREEAETRLEETASQLRTRGHTVTCDFSEGRVAERINASAHTFGVDLIAMATHGSSADIRRFVLGSVAEQVLHEADKPLLLIRPAENGEMQPGK